MRKPKWIIVLDDKGQFMKGYNLNAFSKVMANQFKERYDIPTIKEGDK